MIHPIVLAKKRGRTDGTGLFQLGSNLRYDDSYTLNLDITL